MRAQEPPPAVPAPAEAPAPAPEPPDEPKRTYGVHPTTAAITVDGVLDEAPWQAAATFTLDYETFPAENAPPPVETEMWITYDDRNLYVAIRAQDPEPEKIYARVRDRDNAYRDDFAGVVLDTFNDERRAFEFFVNPLGVQLDLFQNDATGGEDESWDALWASAGRVTGGGYEAEMAIPFSSLRFPRASGPQTWGIDALRIWPRDTRRRFGLNKLPRGSNCYLCHESKLVGFEGITPGRNIEVDPTLTARGTESRDGGAGDFERETKVDPGITGRWGVTPAITLNATINPDFSQVEADAAQLDVNTQFALFFPEKRPFFLEGADLFDTRIQAIYTRNIADPAWGVKVTGKEGGNAFGLISARDTITNLLIPGSQGSRLTSLDQRNTSSILRYRRDLRGSSAIGGLFTSREGGDYRNRVIGIDTLQRFGEGTAVRIEVLGSQTRYPLSLARAFDQPTDDLEGFAVRAVYQQQNRNWTGYFMYNEVSEEFRADLGFIPQVDYRKVYAFHERYRYADDGKRWWSRITYGAETTFNYDHEDNPLQRQVAPYLYISGKKQSELGFYLGLGPSYYRGKVIDRNFLNFNGSLQLNSWVYLSLSGRVGQEIDLANVRQGRILRLIPNVRLEPGRHLKLDLTHFYETLEAGGGRLYRDDLTELRSTYQINVRTFVRLITQYESFQATRERYTFPVDRETNTLFNQLLFSYKLNPQTVLFLGYSDNYFGAGQESVRLDQTDRTVFFKVGYAFVW